MNAVGEQRGGERIAGEAAIGLAVEVKANRLGAIDAPARGRAELARHAGRRNRSNVIRHFIGPFVDADM